MSAPQFAVYLPVDIDRRPEFQNLEDVAGFAGAMSAWVTLWQELAYASRAGRGTGVWPEAGWRPILRSLEQSGIGMATPREALLASGLVVQEGEHFRCPLFIEFNRHLSSGAGITIQQLGNGASLATKAIRAAEEAGTQSTLLFAGDLWVNGDGSPVDTSVAREAELLIRTLDRLLQSPERQPQQFTKGLVNDALAATARGPWREVVKLLGKYRTNPRFTGYTTERVMAEWKEVSAQLAALG